MSSATPHWLQEIRDYWAKLEQERADAARSDGAARGGAEAPEAHTREGVTAGGVSSYGGDASRAALVG